MNSAEAPLAVVSKAGGQVGIRYTTSWSKYGAWWHPNYAYKLWCAMFLTWAFVMALGTDRTAMLLGRQFSAVVGHSWTVSMYRYQQTNGTLIPFSQARAGDLVFFKFPGTDRNAAPVNHIEVATGTLYDGAKIPTIGGNTPYPGTGGDQTSGRGVWKHARYSQYIVAVYRPPYTRVFPAPAVVSETYKPRRIPAMRYGNQSQLSKVVQDIVGRSETGTINTGDITAVKSLQNRLSLTADGVFGAKTARGFLASRGVLRKGDRGLGVRLWQYIAGVPFTQMNSVFDDNTDAWTKAAQKYAGLTADGVVGKNTRDGVVR